MSEPTSLPIAPDDLVEVARAHDRLEATVWAQHLEEYGVMVKTRPSRGWWRVFVRRPEALFVARQDAAMARESLARFGLL